MLLLLAGDAIRDPADLNELVAQGLVRKGSGVGYELTNDGILEYEAMVMPPKEPPGFRPD